MWVDYNDLTPRQQARARRVNSLIRDHKFSCYRFWMTKRGQVSGRNGHWTWTEAYAKLVRAKMKDDFDESFGQRLPAEKTDKGQLHGKWKMADLHLNKEPV